MLKSVPGELAPDTLRKLLVMALVPLLVLVVVIFLALATPAVAQEEGQWEYWNDVAGWQYVLPGEYHQSANGTWIYCGQHYGYNPEAKADVWQWSCKAA
jgi:hypothetical protein